MHMQTRTSEGMTIEQLAARTGLSTRNIRAYQTRGLLPGPALRGRTGYYGQDHVARLELIRDLLGAGYGLRAIGRLLSLVPEAAGPEALGLERELLAPWLDEEPEVVTLDQLLARFPGTGPADVERAVAEGFLEPLADATFRVPSPTLLKAGQDVVALGIPLEAALEATVEVRRRTREAADAFVKLFVDEVWSGFAAEDDRTPERWDEVRRAVERLRPVAGNVVAAAFALSMRDAIERALGDELGGRSEAASA
jgi:DNA-binding transcriptional MerR regulator